MNMKEKYQAIIVAHDAYIVWKTESIAKIIDSISSRVKELYENVGNVVTTDILVLTSYSLTASIDVQISMFPDYIAVTFSDEPCDDMLIVRYDGQTCDTPDPKKLFKSMDFLKDIERHFTVQRAIEMIDKQLDMMLEKYEKRN